MTEEILGVSVAEYRWRPYPSKNMEERDAFSLDKAELRALSHDERKRVRTIRAGYIGKLISHRGMNASNYEFLKDEKEKSPEIKKILEEHHRKEQGVNRVTDNKAFLSQKYTPKGNHETPF